MQGERVCLLAADIPNHESILREVNPAGRKEIYQLFDQRAGIIIEYGSETIKAGYEEMGAPCLVFRPQVSKTRDPNKGELPIKAVMNLSYDQLDFAKQSFKSPYEKNIILHFSILEQCNDYIFSELLRPGRRTESPLIISEPFANPIHCRASILGQLFACYEVGEVMVGVDALFAYFYEVDCDMGRYCSETAVVVSMGANTIHVGSVVEGRVEYSSIRRINIGGNTAFELFSRTLLLKNPQLKNKLTYSFMRYLY
jgi:actin-related protein